jgi:hypothetical protein
MSHGTGTLSPKEREAQKTKEERAEDIAYTINHSLACTATDFINPVIATLTEGRIKGVGGCGHDHSGDHGHHDHAHDHHDHTHKHSHAGTHSITEDLAHSAQKEHWWNKLSWGKFKNSLKTSFNKERLLDWAKGEFIGDFGAILPTIAMQRWCPSVMDRIRKITEPVAGPLFRFGAERSAKQWAKKNAVAQESQDYKDHVDAVYEHEISHLPQAVMWTAFSLALNVGYQKYKDAARPLSNLLLSALTGITVTAGLVVGTRALAPHKVRQFDQFTSRNVFLPATKTVGSIFGVDSKDVERMAGKNKDTQDTGWTGRAKAAPAPSHSLE